VCRAGGARAQGWCVMGSSAILGAAYRGWEMGKGGGCDRINFGVQASGRGGKKQRGLGMQVGDWMVMGQYQCGLECCGYGPVGNHFLIQASEWCQSWGKLL